MKSPKLAIFGLLFLVLPAAGRVNAQQLTLEGQTGGFITPTAYVVESAKGHTFSMPAIGFHFVDASAVIGNIETFNIAEGIKNRAEFGYTRSQHMLGNANDPTMGAFSQLWNSNGMNIFSGKGVIFKDGQFGPVMPGFAAGFVVRAQDKFVSSIVDKELGGNGQRRTRMRTCTSRRPRPGCIRRCRSW